MSLRQFVAIAENPDSDRQSPGYGRAMHHRFFQAGLALTAQHRPVADEGFRPGRFDGCRAAPLIVPVIPIVPAEAEASEMQGVHAVGLVNRHVGISLTERLRRRHRTRRDDDSENRGNDKRAHATDMNAI